MSPAGWTPRKSRARAGGGDCLPGGKAMAGEERDLVSRSFRRHRCLEHLHTIGDGIREAVAESLAQFADCVRTEGSEELRSVEDGAERRRPGTGAAAERLKLSMPKRPAMLDRVGADPRQPRIREIAVTATRAPAAWAASTAWRSASRSYVAAVDCGTGPSSAHCGKSLMIFTQAAPAATSARTAAASSSGATGECMRGKYRFAGARNRPAAVTTGRPATAVRAKPRVTWLGPRYRGSR